MSYRVGKKSSSGSKTTGNKRQANKGQSSKGSSSKGRPNKDQSTQEAQEETVVYLELYCAIYTPHFGNY